MDEAPGTKNFCDPCVRSQTAKNDLQEGRFSASLLRLLKECTLMSDLPVSVADDTCFGNLTRKFRSSSILFMPRWSSKSVI